MSPLLPIERLAFHVAALTALFILICIGFTA